MPGRDTANFLRILNKSNAAIAAREEAEAKRVEPDLIRLQRDAERRKRLGTLRAREHPGKRPRQARSVFGHIDLT